MSLYAAQRTFLDRLRDPSQANLSRGMAVYHHAYRSRLRDALVETFERVRLWIGEDAFDDAALVHIEAHPSASWTLGDFGAGFDATLARLYPEDPEVSELAWLDRALRKAFSGTDAEPLDRAKLATADWEQAVLVTAPTLAVQPFRTNAAAIWRALSQGETPPGAVTLPEHRAIAVWRSGLEPFYRTLAPDEALAVAAMARGARFSEVCAALDSEEATAELGGWLGQWIDEGLVCDLI